MVAASPSISRAEGLHAELKTVNKDSRALDYRAAMLLRQIHDEGHYRVFGHASIYQYAKAEHGLEFRPTQDLLRIARRLESLPVMTAAFAAGELDKTKVRELVAVATPSTESAWVDRAKLLPNRAVEALVAAVGPDGMPPDEIPEPPLKSSHTTLTIRRCQVPGCRNRLYLHIHHIRGRDIPNPHHPSNLVVCCDAHHRVTHDGHFGVERKADGRLVFHSRRGTIPTWGPAPSDAAANGPAPSGDVTVGCQVPDCNH